MRKISILYIFLVIKLSTSIAQDFDWDFLNTKEDGTIYLIDGTTISGNIDIQPCRNQVKITTSDSLFKISTSYIKNIIKNNIDIRMLFFTDSTIIYFGQYIDTAHTLKLYRGFECIYKPTSSMYGMTSTKDYIEAYIVSLDGNYIYDFKRSVSALGKVFQIDNFKKKLLKAFGENPDIVSHLNEYKKIEFDNIPKIVEFINSKY